MGDSLVTACYRVECKIHGALFGILLQKKKTTTGSQMAPKDDPKGHQKMTQLDPTRDGKVKGK